MIKSFANKLTEDVYNGVYTHGIRKAISSSQMKIAQRKLDLLNCAHSVESFHLIPSIKAEGSVRDVHGKHSIPLFGAWRLTFKWNDGAHEVELKA